MLVSAWSSDVCSSDLRRPSRRSSFASCTSSSTCLRSKRGKPMAERSPVDDGFHMPAEWAPHERCWMGWPCRGSLWSEGLEAARTAYAAVAQAIAGFEPATMLANPDAPDEARGRKSAEEGK